MSGEFDATAEPGRYSFLEPKWQKFYAMTVALNDLDLLMPIPPIRNGWQPFFAHQAAEPDKYLFVEKPDEDDLAGRLFTCHTDSGGFTLDVRTAISDKAWNNNDIERSAGRESSRVQAELGLNTPNDEEVHDFELLVDSFATHLLHR